MSRQSHPGLVVPVPVSVAHEEALYPREVFQAFLIHERALAERLEQPVCVITYALPSGRAAVARQFSRICASSLRRMDVVGWMGQETLAVILPCTSAAHAVVVGAKLNEQLAQHRICLSSVIYEYPAVGAPSEVVVPAPAASPALGAAAAGGDQDVRSLDDLCVAPPPPWKRAADLVLAFVALVVAAPLMLVIAGWIKTVSPGPALFRQERVGFLGRPFTLFKFRSMAVAAPAGVHQKHLESLMASQAPLLKLDQQDQRLIPGAHWLRASGLDELPQLVNILRGEMSLIGPRPCVPYEYARLRAWHRHRFHVLPGLTGLWQVSGKNSTTFEQMMRLDSAYTLRLSILRDARILLKTLPAVCLQVWAIVGNIKK
jgi:lipopolysaccharide/colanic/teichoic acid biosynthesis glycosyltransferase